MSKGQEYFMHAFSVLASLLTLCALCAPVGAQTPAYPVKPIRLVLGFSPGGAADYVSRTVGEALGRVWG